jgi:hypothetical protein
MKIHNISLRGIKVDPLAHELTTSEATQPYLDCAIKAYCNDALALESAIEVAGTCRSKSAIRGEYFPR